MAKKVSQLDAIASIADADLVHMIDIGSPNVSKKAPWTTVRTKINEDFYTKDQTDNLVQGAQFDFYISDTADPVIAGYNVMFPEDTEQAQSSVVQTISGADTLIKSFITEADEPTFTTIVQGIMDGHFHAQKTAGTQDIFFYWELYKRTTGGTETLLGTSEDSDTITASSIPYNLHMSIVEDVEIGATDRLVVKLIGTPTGAGSTPDITIFMEGDDNSRVGIRTTLSSFDDRYVQLESPRKTLLIGGDFRTNAWQRGTTFDDSTTPANNDDTYLVDNWKLLAEDDDYVDVSQDTDSSLLFTVTAGGAGNKFGFVQMLEGINSLDAIGAKVSAAIEAKGSGNVDDLRMAIIAWDGTVDSMTSDVVDTWNGAGTNPTLVANWTYENTPVALALLSDYQTFSIEDINVDTAGTKNLAVFFWSDAKDTSATDTLNVKRVRLEIGTKFTGFVQEHPNEVLADTMRYLQKVTGRNGSIIGTGVSSSTTAGFIELRYTRKRVTPTITITQTNLEYTNGSASGAATGATVSNAALENALVSITTGGGLTNGNGLIIKYGTNNEGVIVSAEL